MWLSEVMKVALMLHINLQKMALTSPALYTSTTGLNDPDADPSDCHLIHVSD